MAHSDAPTLGGLGRSDLSCRNLWLNSHPIDNRKKIKTEYKKIANHGLNFNQMLHSMIIFVWMVLICSRA